MSKEIDETQVVVVPIKRYEELLDKEFFVNSILCTENLNVEQIKLLKNTFIKVRENKYNTENFKK